MGGLVHEPIRILVPQDKEEAANALIDAADEDDAEQ